MGGPPCITFGPTEFDELILTFTGPTIVDAILEPAHGVVNLTQDDVTFDSHSVSLAWVDTEWDGNETILVNLVLVPEPSTALLLMTGLLALASYRRGRALG